jgi:hypothetical protein
MRRAVTDIDLAPYDGDSRGRQTLEVPLARFVAGARGEQNVPYLFRVRNMFFLKARYRQVLPGTAPLPIKELVNGPFQN